LVSLRSLLLWRSDMARVVIVAEVCLYREGLSLALEHRNGLQVVGSASGVSDAVHLAVGGCPDIVLLDMAIPDVEGIVRSFIEHAPNASIVGLGVAEDEQHVLACIEIGVSAYVRKEGSVDELIAVIENVVQGGMVCPPKITGALARRVTSLADSRSAKEIGLLSLREREVADLLDEGCSNKQIAVRLHIEVATVKNHVHHILEKVGARSRGEAAARVRRAIMQRDMASQKEHA